MKPTKTMLALLASTVLVAPASAANDNWTGTTSSDWFTAGNWSGGVPTSTSAVFIANTLNNPVQLNTSTSLNGSSGALTVGVGAAPGGSEVLKLGTGVTLTMGARPVSLLGGTITGPGTLSATGTISGYGTISSQISGTSFTANSTDGTVYSFSPSFVNGTPGTPITLIGQNNLTSDTFTIQNHGNFNFQGVTLTTPTLSGVSTNLNAGSLGGNNTYGLFTFSGAPSTIVGTINNTNYQQFDINTTVHLNGVSLTNTWATNVPPFWVINAGGTLDNTVGNSSLNGHMATVMNGGAITNSGGGTFTAAGLVTGFGTITGPMTFTGGVQAKGGTLTIDGTNGSGMVAASAGWGTAGGANDVLDLKGNITFGPSGSFPAAVALNPNGATVQLDGATINTPAAGIQVNHGTVNIASGVNTLNGRFTGAGDGTTASYNIANGATLTLNNTSGKTAIFGTNFTMAQNASLNSGPNQGITLSGNFSYQQTNPLSWTYGATPGIGPDLTMTGAAANLEVGSVNQGDTPGGFLNNFALDSLTINGSGTTTANVSLVDLFSNAGTAGSEVLYLDALFGTSMTTYGTLNLNGITAYLAGYGMLMDGLYTDANGDLVNITGAPVSPVPEPSTWLMMAMGFFGLGFAFRQRRRKVAFA